MDELIDITDDQGNLLGKTELKSVIHKKGYYHHTTHIWFYTNKGEVLLSQRSAKKTICPLLWDVSVAGHIDAGETPEEGGIRETQEEIGLHITQHDLIKIGVFKCFQSYDYGVIDNEFHNTFICELKVPLESLTPQEEEVEALKLVALDEFHSLIKNLNTNDNGNHLVPSNKAYYELVLKNIKNNLTPS